MKLKKILQYFLFLPTIINSQKLQKRIHSKSIVITGASSGIGKELAIYLSKLNVPIHLILIARRIELLEEIQQQHSSSNVKIDIFQADLREENDLQSLSLFLLSLQNGIDYFVNNAGKSIYRPIFQSLDRVHDFERTMAINYFAPVKLLLNIIPVLQKNKGQIINISTINVLMTPFPHWTAYQASKSAFNTWLLSAELELKEHNIDVTSIYLPLVKTPMIEPTKKYNNAPAMSTEQVAKIIAKSMYTKKRRYQPWWLLYLELSSVLFKKLNLYVLSHTINRRR